MLLVLAVDSQPALGISTMLISADGDTSDDQPRIQAALDDVQANGGGVVHLTQGKYYIGPSNGAEPGASGDYSLQIGSNVHLKMDRDVTLVRRSSGGAPDNAAKKRCQEPLLMVPDMLCRKPQSAS